MALLYALGSSIAILLSNNSLLAHFLSSWRAMQLQELRRTLRDTDTAKAHERASAPEQQPPRRAGPKPVAALRWSSRLRVSALPRNMQGVTRAARLAQRIAQTRSREAACHSCHHCRQRKPVQECRLCSTCTRGFCHSGAVQADPGLKAPGFKV